MGDTTMDNAIRSLWKHLEEIDGTNMDGRVKNILITKLQTCELWAKELYTDSMKK